LEIEQPYFEVEGAQAERNLRLDGANSWTIGRSPENAFAFDDDAMSRRHALVQQMQPGKFYMIDLGSRNGSSLNGRRITTSVELHDGDSILCGETSLVFHNPMGKAEAGPASSDQAADAASEDEHATLILYQKRLITVLVVDIRGFTQLARQIDEALLAQSMGTWFRELGSMLRRSGCATDKYIGDAAMGVWVHEGQIPDQEQIRCVLETLLKIQECTASLHQQFQLPSPVRIGAGINTGLSVMSNSGPHEHPDFSPLGDSVNTAFRLESATKNTEFDVALGRLTFECLSGAADAVKYFEKQFVELRGYQQPVETWLTSYSKLEEFLVGEREREP
jgi:adenylate cyclase